MADRSVVVKLIADNGSFDSTMTTSAKKVEDVGTSADRAAKLARSAFDQIKVAGASLLGIAALKSGQDLINLKQSAQIAFTAITGSAQSASTAIQQIYTWDQSNPIPFQNALAAGQKLAAFGVDMQNVVPTLQAVADATGAVGGNADTFDRIALAMGQIQTKGKLSAEEMLQLAEAGLPAWQILAETIGTTIPDAMKRAQDGTIDADTALEALRQGIEQRFPNAAQNLKNTTLGAFQSLKAGIRDGTASILEPLQGIESQSALAAGALVRNVGSAIGSTFAGFAPVLSGVASGLHGVAVAAGAVPPPITAIGLAMLATNLASGKLSSGWDTLRIKAMYAGDALQNAGSIWGRIGDDAAMAGVSRMRVGLGLVGGAARSAGSALLGAFGGPLGVALIGATAGVSLLSAQWDAAKPKVTDFTAAIDANTGALTANSQAAAAKALSESGAFDKIKAAGIDTETYTKAVLGNAEAQKEVNKALADVPIGGGGEQAKQRYVLAAATRQYNSDLQHFAKTQTDVNDVLHASGPATKVLQTGLEDTAAAAKEAQQAFMSTQAAADSMVAGMVNSGLQLRQQIQGALTSFIDPVSAWSTASDAVNKRVSVSSNPAVKAADAAVKAGRKRADATKKSATDEKNAAVKAAQQIRDAIVNRGKAEVKITKDAQTNAQKRVDAATKEVNDLKKLSDQQKKDAEDAASTLDKAKFDLQAATLNRERAAAGLAAAQSPIERANWQNAYNNAVRDEASAKQTAASAQSDYDTKTQKAAASQAGLTQATKDQQSAQNALAQAKSDAAAAAEVASQRQQAADAALASAKEKADARYQKAIDASQAMLQALIDKQDAAKTSAQDMASGSADAVTGMVQKVAPSFDQWMTQLRDQKKAQDDWAKNLRELSSKLPGDVVQYLAGLGPGAAGAIASMNQQSQAKLNEAVPLLRGAMPAWTDAITNGILAGIPGTAASAARLGNDTLNAMMAELQKGDRPLSQILANYGVIMQQGADGHPIFLRVGVDTSQVAAGLYNAAIQAQNDLANYYGASYNPVTYWGQGAHYASGGMVGDGWFWTGEQGPELGYKQGSAVRIFPAGQSAAMSVPQPAPASSGPSIAIYDYSTTYYPQGVPDSVARNQRAANFAAQVTMG